MQAFEYRQGDKVIYAGLAGEPRGIGIVLKCVGLSESFALDGRYVASLQPAPG